MNIRIYEDPISVYYNIDGNWTAHNRLGQDTLASRLSVRVSSVSIYQEGSLGLTRKWAYLPTWMRIV